MIATASRPLPTDLIDAMPPQEPEAELGLLGAMIDDPTIVPAIVPLVAAEDFCDPDQGELFRAIVLLHDAGERIGDPILLVRSLERLNVPESVRSWAFLNRLIDTGITYNAVPYAIRIREAAALRRFLHVGLELVRRVHATGASPNSLACWLGDQVAVHDAHAAPAESLTLGEIGDQVIGELRIAAGSGSTRGVFSGFMEVDEQLGGMQAGELVILAARPGVGKTTFATQVAMHGAERGDVLFVSLEMAQAELVRRLLCGMAAVDTRDVRCGRLVPSQIDRMAAVVDSVRALPLRVWAPARATVERIAGVARLEARRGSLSFIIVDYVSLVAPTDGRIPRHEQVAHVSRSLKALAKGLEVPVLALAQLNREAEKERPTKAMLRESGALEQDADMVLFLHRAENSQTTEFIVAKHRHGETGMLKLGWSREGIRFTTAESFE